MFLPSTAGVSVPSDVINPALSTTAARPSGGWSSIIGIVTAIVGNILISFALNAQRYAHIKLSQERDEQQEKQRLHARKDKRRSGYGTQQSEIAEERAKKNLSAQQHGKSMGPSGEDGSVARESDPLLPSSDSRRSSASDSTARPDANPAVTKSYLSSPWWWGGIALMTVGECGNFLAYGFAPASVVSPLGVVALVSNCLIAPLMLHETFRRRDALGVVIAVAGCVTVVLSASGSNPKLDQDEIWHLISRWEFETYLGITVFLIIILMAGSNKYGGRSILIDLGLVGLFGGYTALSTKGVASLLSNKIWHVITFPITYLLVAVLVTTAIMQIKYVNRALQRFDSTQVIPVQFVMFTLSVIIGSAILYRDFERQSASDAAKFFAGCALTFLGVWCITSGRSHDQDSDEESGTDEEEDAIDLVDEEGQQPEIRERDDGTVRRSSLRPDAPMRLRSSQSEAPLFEFTLTESAKANASSFGDPSPFTENTWGLDATPAIRSTVHEDGSTLPQTGRQNKPPPFHATTSAPVLPTAALRPQRPPTPSRRTGPASPVIPRDDRPRTPEGQQTLDPATASTPRFGSVNKHSIAGMLPGPLMNPLSNSLSVIVAESLRRGVDTAPGNSLKRRALRSSKSARRLENPRNSITEDTTAGGRPPTRRGVSEMVSPRPGPGPGADGDGSPKGRGRSLSVTLADMLRSKRSRRGTLEGEEGT